MSPGDNDLLETASQTESVVGSEAGYQMERSLIEDDGAHASEETGLLSDGAQDHSDDPVLRKPSWADSDFDHLPPWRRPSVWWLLGPYALFTLAFGGSLVPKLNLIIELVCRQYYSDRAAADAGVHGSRILLGGDNPECRTGAVQREVAAFTLVLSVIVGILTTYTAPTLGSLSDRYGRKPMMLFCSFGGMAGELITILAAKYPHVVHYKWMILGSVFDGLAGSFTAGSVLSHSYTSDCTPPSKRSVSIGYLHSCLFSGLAFGPLLAAFLVKKTGSLLSIFYVVLGCHAIFILFVYFVTPESLSKRKQILAREKYAKQRREESDPPAWVARLSSLPWGSGLGKALRVLEVANPLAPLKILRPPGPRNKKARRNLTTLAAIDTVLLGSTMGMGTVTILYSEFIFGWGTVESSRFISLVSSVRFFVLMGIFPIVNYVFRTRPAARRRRMLPPQSQPAVEKNAGADELDIWVIRTAMLSDIIGVCGYIFVRTQALFILCAVITAFGGLGSATVQSSITKHAPPERVGQLLGAIGVLHALARVVSPIVFNGLYAITVDSFPQAFFVLMTSLFAVILVASFVVRPHVSMEDEDDQSSPYLIERPELHSRNISEDTLEDDELIPGL
ncbi:hypothetical protein VTK73DRAFT_8311 [Phialemonium thermophilum]|uniref:Major facilitator superfamily (MFS) profile domain-containing protein n=1 Tax=Phialemonium thermophilum TaxID=223376 RepID=A0ABR3Y777_9PEZI